MTQAQELYEQRIRAMIPADRLELARLILDELAPATVSQTAHAIALQLRSPRLVNPSQSAQFIKQVTDVGV